MLDNGFKLEVESLISKDISADKAIGGYNDLVTADTSGELEMAIFGERKVRAAR